MVTSRSKQLTGSGWRSKLVGLLVFLFLFVALKFGMDFSLTYTIGAASVSEVASEVFRAACGSCVAWRLSKLWHWRRRSEWGGPLLVDASQETFPSRRIASVLPLLLGLAIIGAAIMLSHGEISDHELRPYANTTFLGAAVYFLWAANTVTFAKLEFRQAGIIHGSSFIPWEMVEAWQWEDWATSRNCLRLYLQQRQKIRILAQTRLEIPAPKYDDVTRLMKQQIPVTE